MSRYLERIASLATGQGPRLHPRPRYRYGDAPAWAPADALTAQAHTTRRDDATPDVREPRVTQRVGPLREEGEHDAQWPQTFEAPLAEPQPEARHAPRDTAYTETTAARLLPLRAAQDDHGNAPRAEPDGAAMLASATPHQAWQQGGTPAAGRMQFDGAPREARGREAARRDTRANEPPTVTVHIGHIDVRAIAAPISAPAPGANARPSAAGPRRPSLDAYLRTRDRERQ